MARLSQRVTCHPHMSRTCLIGFPALPHLSRAATRRGEGSGQWLGADDRRERSCARGGTELERPPHLLSSLTTVTTPYPNNSPTLLK